MRRIAALIDWKDVQVLKIPRQRNTCYFSVLMLVAELCHTPCMTELCACAGICGVGRVGEDSL